MPNENLKTEFKKGQTVYMVSRHYSERNREVIIEKIGRKYITIYPYRFTLSGIGYDDIYTPEFDLYESKAAYELAVEEMKYRRSISMALDGLKHKLTLDQIQRIEKILNEPVIDID